MIAYTLVHWVTIGVLVFFIVYISWLAREISKAPIIDEPPCTYCRDTGYVRFEMLSNPNPRVTVYEIHERPCTCTAGIGKTRRRVA